jgi:hypothetical protein
MKKKTVSCLLRLDHKVHMLLKKLFPDFSFNVPRSGLPLLVAFTSIGNWRDFKRFNYQKYPEDLQLSLLCLWIVGYSARSFFIEKDIIYCCGDVYCLKAEKSRVLKGKEITCLEDIEACLSRILEEYPVFSSDVVLWV